MRIETTDFDKYEIVLDNWGYPKKTIVYEANEKDVLVPSFIRQVDFVSCPKKKLEITVAENGFILKQGAIINVVTNDYNLDSEIKSMIYHEVDSEEKIDEEYLEDAELQTITLKFNTKYKGGQVEHDE